MKNKKKKGEAKKVSVRAYTRIRNGKREKVRQHKRRYPKKKSRFF